MSLRHRWISLREATAYVARWHRHLEPPRGGIVALAAWRGDALEPVGVVIIGRPTSRVTQARGDTVEIVRCAVPAGERNAASFLYGRARRVAQAMGFTRVVTSSLQSKSGTSLRAAGFTLASEDAGASWDRKNRRRVDQTAAQRAPERRWESLIQQEKQHGAA